MNHIVITVLLNGDNSPENEKWAKKKFTCHEYAHDRESRVIRCFNKNKREFGRLIYSERDFVEIYDKSKDTSVGVKK